MMGLDKTPALAGEKSVPSPFAEYKWFKCLQTKIAEKQI
jgi:hypothetical protein